MKEISSPHNDLIKRTLLIREKSRVRRKLSQFLVEGRREVERALLAGYEPLQLFVCLPILGEFGGKLAEAIQSAPTASVPESLYAKIALRGSSEGILALFRAPLHPLDDLRLSGDAPLLLVLEAPEKPGNLGALFRTADAAGIDGVLLADPQTDIYNPQCIRSSLGGVFTRPIGTGSSQEVADFLMSKSVRVCCAALTASVPYHSLDYTGPTGLVLGAEDKGLSPFWLERSDANVIIPMSGIVDSLNLSVSAAVLIFEAVRQRTIK